MKLVVLLLSALSCCAGVSPNALHIQSSIPYRFGPVAYYSPGSPQNTMNGAGMSVQKNIAPETRENWLLWSEDFTQASWLTWNGLTKVGIASGVGPSGEDAMELSFGANADSALYQQLSSLPDGSHNWYIRSKSGTTSVRLAYSVVGPTYTTDLTLDTTWVLFAQPMAFYSGACDVSLRNNSTGDSANIYVLRAQLRRATKSPAYVKTEGIRYVSEDRDLLQSTAASQPLLSRADNKGNLLLQSETFQTTWTRYDINPFGVSDTGTAGAGSFANTGRTLDPLGGNASDFIQEDATTGDTHQVGQTVSVTLPVGSYVFPIYAKPAGRNILLVRLVGSSGNAQVFFDVQNGLVGTVTSSGTTTGVSGSISSAPNGFYLCKVFLTLGTVEAQTAYIYTGTDTFDIAYDGDNTSGLFLWGASLRQSSWDSDYIPTTTTPAYPGQNGQRVLVFDGVDDYMKTATFPFVQPETVMGVFEQVSWTRYNVVLGAYTPDTSYIYQNSSTPDLSQYAGGVASQNNEATLGAAHLLTTIFNGASSSIRVNASTPTSGDAGTAGLNGIQLPGNGVGLFANIRTGDLFLFDRVLTSAEQSCLVQWLGRRNGMNVW